MPDQQTKVTSNHDEIRRWVEERGGHPATVPGMSEAEGAAGLLCFKFGDESEELEPVSWDEFFEKFDKNDLVMLYREETEEGGESRFFKFVSGETAERAVR